MPSSVKEDVVNLMSEEESLSSSADGSTTSSFVDVRMVIRILFLICKAYNENKETIPVFGLLSTQLL